MPFLESFLQQSNSQKHQEQKYLKKDVKAINDMQKRLAFKLLNKECEHIKELTSDYMRQWIKHNGKEFRKIIKREPHFISEYKQKSEEVLNEVSKRLSNY